MGNLRDYSFSGIVKPIPFKQGKFYRWVTNILGKEPDPDFSPEDLIGKECLIFLSKRNKNFYYVTDVFMSYEWASKGKIMLSFLPLFEISFLPQHYFYLIFRLFYSCVRV
ncbi:MAG: hypothetical protein AB1480_12570 [Nitrospirota bacterium]